MSVWGGHLWWCCCGFWVKSSDVDFIFGLNIRWFWNWGAMLFVYRCLNPFSPRKKHQKKEARTATRHNLIQKKLNFYLKHNRICTDCWVGSEKKNPERFALGCNISRINRHINTPQTWAETKDQWQTRPGGAWGDLMSYRKGRVFSMLYFSYVAYHQFLRSTSSVLILFVILVIN